MSTPVYSRWGIDVFEGDCLDVLREMPDCTVDSIVTDPPAGIRFMSKAWDSDMGGRHSWVAWLSERMTEAYRVLKPGGHALVWALPRTSHWTAWALEDAGFEVRDCVVHLFASGFPKSMDVSQAIDRAAGAQRVVLREKTYALRNEGGYSGGLNTTKPRSESCEVTAPATDAARQWDGWGTALKPSQEMWWLVRKPLDGTVAATMQQWGTGALNIDGCRVAHGDDVDLSQVQRQQQGEDNGWRFAKGMVGSAAPMYKPGGRWPSNVTLTHAAILDPATGEPVGDACADGCVDGCPVRELDAQSGVLTSGLYRPEHADNGKAAGTYGSMTGRARETATYGDRGGASRFFPTFRWEAKAPSSERPRINGNAHPTVKPVNLLRWMTRLVTQPGGTVLDLFAGTGTTGQAARAEGFQAVLIERDPDSIAYIKARLDGLPKTELVGETSAAALNESDPIDLFDFLNEEAS